MLHGCASAYTIDQLATAIGKAENSKSHPYGVLAHYKHTTPRQACLNTIKHQYRLWKQSGLNMPFVDYLGSKYCPLSDNRDIHHINQYWIKNVNYWITKR